jgi:hypothetical protein
MLVQPELQWKPLDAFRIRNCRRHSLRIAGTLTSTQHDDSGSPSDAAERIREHACIYALIETAAPQETRTGLTSTSPRTQRAALVALDQMPNGGLTADDVLSHLNANDSALRSTAVWILRRHSDWGETLATYFETRLAQAESLSQDESELTANLLASLAESPTIQSLIQKHLNGNHKPAAELCLNAIAQTTLSTARRPGWMLSMNNLRRRQIPISRRSSLLC